MYNDRHMTGKSPKNVDKKRYQEKPENVERRDVMVQATVKNIGMKVVPQKNSQTQMARDAGYSESYAQNPQRIRTTKKFREKFDEMITDEMVLEWHANLGQARKLDHMVFPLAVEDEDIEDFLRSVNCVLRKIVHSTQSKHAYFWAFDNKAKKDAIDMAYKVKGSYAPTRVEDVTKDPLRQLSDAELMEEIKKAQNFLKKKN